MSRKHFSKYWVRYYPHSAQNFAPVISRVVLDQLFFDIFSQRVGVGVFEKGALGKLGAAPPSNKQEGYKKKKLKQQV